MDSRRMSRRYSSSTNKEIQRVMHRMCECGCWFFFFSPLSPLFLTPFQCLKLYRVWFGSNNRYCRNKGSMDMKIPVHCLPYGLMRIQSSTAPTHFWAYSRQIQISFLFLKCGGMGIKNDADFPIIFSLSSFLAFPLFSFPTLFSSLVCL